LESDAVFGKVVNMVTPRFNRVSADRCFNNRFVRAAAFAIAYALAVPAFGEVDLTGAWSSSTIGDDVLLLGDYTGFPYNAAGREKALSYSQSQISEPERVCLSYPQTQLFGGPFGLRISKETAPNGQILAWKIAEWEDRAPMTIWMDGRAEPPPFAPHERTGFTTGHWEGNVLVSRTTHMKTGFIRRNGAAHSDQAVLTIRFLRHDDLLTLAARLDDPIYLSEPLYWTRTFQFSRARVEQLEGPCVQGDEGVEEGVVPHFLPGQNPFLDEMNKAYHIPVIASQGGAETMYPEFRSKIKDGFTIVEQCTRCNGGRGGPPPQ
jgi:hypothetical protein